MPRMTFITNRGSEQEQKEIIHYSMLDFLKSLSGDRIALVIISVTTKKTSPGLQVKPLQIMLKDRGEIITKE